MEFIIIGIVGIVLSGILSQRYYRSADPLQRVVGSMEGKAMGGVVPVWVSLVNLTSFGFLIYGIFTLFR